MTQPLSSAQLILLRESAHVLERQAAANEHDVQQLLTSAESELHDSRFALKGSAELMREALRNHSTNIAANIGFIRQLCLGAKKHHLATVQMVADLADRHAAPSGNLSASNDVLVVDDHSDNLEYLSLTLQNAGFIVRTASNGLDALFAAHQLRPTVIIMDLMMPILDGVEATRLIKAREDLRHVHVIAHTAMARPPNDELFSAVLSKPSPPDQLLATVKKFLNNGRDSPQ